MPRLRALGTAAATAAAGLALVASLAPSASAATRTNYALSGQGLGLRVTGGSLPASSGDLANVSSGCTSLAGVRATNHAAAVALPGGLGTIGAMVSNTWTSTSAGGTVNRYSETEIAGITVTDPVLHATLLKIDGLDSLAHVWHNSSGYHYATSMTATKVTSSGRTTSLPTPGQPLTIPGVGTLAMGEKNRAKDAHHAFARITGLDLTLTPPGGQKTVLNLAAVRAEIDGGIRAGIFQGNAAATKLSVLGGTLTSSGQPEISMPCAGTGGKVQTRSLAAVPLSSKGAPINLSNATSQQRGTQYIKNGERYASGYERSFVSTINLGNGALVITGLAAQANVTRTGAGFNTVTANANGTTAAKIVANGTTVPGLSQLNGKKITVPGGVATVQTSVLQKLRAGKKVIGERVIGLQIKLLDSSTATTTVIDIANAELRIKND